MKEVKSISETMVWDQGTNLKKDIQIILYISISSLFTVTFRLIFIGIMDISFREKKTRRRLLQYKNKSTVMPYVRMSRWIVIAFSCPPPEWNSGASSFCPVCDSVSLSVTLWQQNNIGHNIWTVRDRDFIFGMHTQLMKPFQMTPRSMNLQPLPGPSH